MTTRAVVVGAGVIGLTTALELARDGWEVTVRTAESPGGTTSSVAAAVWFPYLVGPVDAVRQWGRDSAEVFAELSGQDDVPVQARTMHELLRQPPDDAAWRSDMPDLDDRPTLPEWAVAGWTYTTWVADMPHYLRWLGAELDEADVGRWVAPVSDITEAFRLDVDLVVDCVGVDAARLVGDDTVEPVRGQIVLVDAPSVTDVWLDPDHPDGATYVIPRSDMVVCGGTAERGVWDRTPDDAVTRDILDRCAALVPAIADAPVRHAAVGLRPTRPEVRLEVEHTPFGPVLHHYGHGGAGVTLSWGAARAAARLARDLRG